MVPIDIVVQCFNLSVALDVVRESRLYVAAGIKVYGDTKEERREQASINFCHLTLASHSFSLKILLVSSC